MSSSSSPASSSTAAPAEPHQTPPSIPAPETSGSAQASNVPGSQNLANGGQQMFPMFDPVTVPGSVPVQNSEVNDHGAGLYAVPFSPFMGTMAGPSPSTLIPLRYNIPTRTSATGAVRENQGQEARQAHGPQRQVAVRRFQFAIQLDLSLILKLAAAIFLFNQDGSRQRLFILIFCATVLYLYQTGALTPLLRWIKRGAAPPQQRLAVPPENAPLIEGNAGGDDQNRDLNEPAAGAEGVPAQQEAEAEPEPEPERANRINWWGIVREIQTIVVGFISSLLPGFHHND